MMDIKKITPPLISKCLKIMIFCAICFSCTFASELEPTSLEQTERHVEKLEGLHFVLEPLTPTNASMWLSFVENQRKSSETKQSTIFHTNKQQRVLFQSLSPL